MTRRATLAAFTLALALLRRAHATATNITIDDNNGDTSTGQRPIYAPPGVWNYGPICSGCLVQPAPSFAFDGSWHDVTASPTDDGFRNVTITFNGTAVYVFCIVPNYVQDATTLANMSFWLDGSYVGGYIHIPTTDTTILYDVPVYANSTVADGQHTIVVRAEGQVNPSLLLFDYAMYTYDDSSGATPTSSSVSAGTSTAPPSTSSTSSPPYTSHHSPLGAIIGGVVGAVVVISAVAVGVWLCWRRRRSHRHGDAVQVVHGSKSERQLDEIDEAVMPDPFLTPLAGTNNYDPLLAHFSSSEPYLSQHANASTDNTFAPPQASTTQLSTTHSLPPGAAPPMTPTSVSGSSAPRSKAAARQEELSRHLQDMERQVVVLQHQGQESIFAPSSVGVASSAGDSSQDEELRRKVEVLQREVERLRAQQQAGPLTFDVPPAYSGQEERGEIRSDNRPPEAEA